MKASAEIGQLAGALAKAQAKFRKVHKTETADEGYAFAPIAGYIAAVRPALASEGIALTLPTRTAVNGTTSVVISRVVLLHSSGQTLESDEVEIPLPDWQPASIAAMAGWAQRIALTSFLAVRAEGDERAAARKTEPKPDEGRNGSTHHEIPPPAPEPARAEAAPEPPPLPVKSAIEQARENMLLAEASEIFEQALAAGVEVGQFRVEVERILGHPYRQEVEWTEDDRAHLRAEFQALRELEGRPLAEPTAELEPEPEAQPEPHSETLPLLPDAAEPKPRRKRRAREEELPIRRLVPTDEADTFVPEPVS